MRRPSRGEGDRGNKRIYPIPIYSKDCLQLSLEKTAKVRSAKLHPFICSRRKNQFIITFTLPNLPQSFHVILLPEYELRL